MVWWATVHTNLIHSSRLNEPRCMRLWLAAFAAMHTGHVGWPHRLSTFNILIAGLKSDKVLLFSRLRKVS